MNHHFHHQLVFVHCHLFLHSPCHLAAFCLLAEQPAYSDSECSEEFHHKRGDPSFVWSFAHNQCSFPDHLPSLEEKNVTHRLDDDWKLNEKEWGKSGQVLSSTELPQVWNFCR